MWTMAQRQRLALEHQILQDEGFSQFSVYHHASNDSYYASGLATSGSGRCTTALDANPVRLSNAATAAYVT